MTSASEERGGDGENRQRSFKKGKSVNPFFEREDKNPTQSHYLIRGAWVSLVVSVFAFSTFARRQGLRGSGRTYDSSLVGPSRDRGAGKETERVKCTGTTIF